MKTEIFEKRNLEIIENPIDVGFIKRTSNAKTFRGFLEGCIKKTQNDRNYEILKLLEEIKRTFNKFYPQKKERTKKFCFLLIARLLWEKGVKEYVEAARILRESCSDLQFQLLGFVENNNPRSVSEEQIHKWEHDGRIIWLGSADDVRPYIAEADCVVLPSYREGTPRSLLEAASMGKPLITTDAVGCREVVDDGVNGFLCKSQDSADLASVMQRMLELTDEQRMTMGKKSREKVVREFDEQIVINKYLETIEEVTKPKDGSPHS